MVTPTQAILGRKGPIKYRLYFGAGGLVFGLIVGIVQGIKIGHGSNHGAANKDSAGGGAWPASARPPRPGMRSGGAYRLRGGAHATVPEAATPPLQPDHEASPLGTTDGTPST
jgi:hypothetical protein